MNRPNPRSPLSSFFATVVACAFAFQMMTGEARAASSVEPGKTRVAAPLPELPSVDTTKDVRQIPIDEKRANKVYRISTSPGYPAIVEFPEAFAAAPACGDCTDAAILRAAKPGAPPPKIDGLFLIDVFQEQHYFTIKPAKYPGLQPDGTNIPVDEFVTTVNVRLVSQLTITVEVSLVEDRGKADARVVFTLPQRAGESSYVQQEIAKMKAQLEQQYAAKVEEGLGRAFIRMLAAPHQCAAIDARTRHEDLVLQVFELCRFGSRLYVQFRLENRGRVPFEIGEVMGKKSTGKLYAPIEQAAPPLLVADRIEFQKVASGVAAFELADGEDKVRSFELTVTEAGGRSRDITLSGFGF
jgi:hypothetical protein